MRRGDHRENARVKVPLGTNMSYTISGMALLAAAVCAGVLIMSAAGAPGISSEILLRATSSWDGALYKAYPKGAPELTVRRIEIPAGGALVLHKHPMPSAAYVLSGEITVEEPSGAKRHFTAGQVLPETVNAAHRGVVGATPAVFIVFYAGVKGMELSTPLAEGPHE
jgi:quercetin dioxygenase-like cupin family protein